MKPDAKKLLKLFSSVTKSDSWKLNGIIEVQDQTHTYAFITTWKLSSRLNADKQVTEVVSPKFSKIRAWFIFDFFAIVRIK